MKAHKAIKLAKQLGILCRPVSVGWKGFGLDPGDECFFEYDPDYRGPYHPAPGLFLAEWELVTRDQIKKEDEASDDGF